MSFLVDMYKNSSEKRNTLVEKQSKINVAEYLKEIPSLAEVGAQQPCS